MIFQRRSMTLLLSLMMVLLAACVAPAQTAPPATASDTNAVSTKANTTRGTLRIAHPLFSGGKESLDPISPTNFANAIVILYDRLVRLGDDGRVAPDLAVSWTPDKSAKEWVFALRKGVKFHNGQPLTSADVAYSFGRILAPKSTSSLASTLSLIDRIETPDKQTVVFRLKQSDADFPLLLVEYTARIIPDGSGDTIGATGIGTGPFKLKSFNAEGTTVLVANDDYWRGAPGLAAIELIGIADAKARSAAVLAGQIDALLNTTAVQGDLFAANPDFVTQSFPTGEWYSLLMRTDTPPFNDVRVRQAMRLVADRQVMVDLVLGGQGTVACDTPVGPKDANHWETTCPQDIERAKKLLADAGHPGGLDVTLFTSDLEAWMTPLAEVYKQQAAAAGINVTLKVVPADGYFTEIWLKAPFYPAFWSERPADLILNLLWRSTADWNESHYQNPKFDQLLDKARQELDFEARRKLYQQAQQILVEDGGNLIPFYVNLTHVYSAHVAGINPVSYREFNWETITKSK